MAQDRSAYSPPVPKSYVTQKQLKDALAREGKERLRNAEGIKVLNTRVGGLDRRVNGVVVVNKVQSEEISKLDKAMKLDGALEFAESYDGNTLELLPLVKGAVKSGMLDKTKVSPAVIGGIGLVLNILSTNPAVLGGLLPQLGTGGTTSETSTGGGTQ